MYGVSICVGYVMPKVWSVNCWLLTFFFLQLLGSILSILCPAKLLSNADFAPLNYGAMQTLPHKFMKPSFFSPLNYEAMQTLPRKIM